MQQIYKARKAVYTEDTVRLLVFVVMAGGILWAYSLKKLKLNAALSLVILLLLIDLGGISNRYLNRDLFTTKSRSQTAFSATNADRLILKDTSRYRVYESGLRLAGARTSYFHNAIGGYHGAKPRRYQEVFELFETLQREEILNILNVKYVLYESEEGGLKPLMNPENLGNAWFVENLTHTASPDETYQKLATIDFSKEAVSESLNIKDIPKNYVSDSLATISLTDHQPGLLRYNTQASEDSFAVFSEMHYPTGWVATIDGVELPHYNVNYVLRGMPIPKGEHLIEFTFDPPVVRLGGRIQWISFLVFMSLFAFGVRAKFKSNTL